MTITKSEVLATDSWQSHDRPGWTNIAAGLASFAIALILVALLMG